MMPKLLINGGKALHGTVSPVPNKNSILKLIPATLLADAPSHIHNVPTTSDVKYLLQIFEKMGGKYTWSENDQPHTTKKTLNLDPRGINAPLIDPELSTKMKASVMFAGPLLAKFGKVMMPMPQGCKLGTRPLDVLIENMVNMGAEYTYHKGSYELTTSGLKGTKVRQRFPSVTGTENLILMAVCAKGTTEIYNAGCEPHTQDLCNMLVSMGANIDGIGSNKLIIEGVSNLKGADWTVISDHLDVGGYIVATAMTRGEVTIENACTQHIGMIQQMMRKLGVRILIDYEQDTITIPAKQDLVIQKTIKGTPWRTHAWARPLLPPDFVHSCVVLALKSSGQAIFDNLYYEYSWFFVQELSKMKANIIMANPVTVITSGPTDFKPAKLYCSDIIQASYALLLCALSAKGTSELHSINPLFRRFPDFISKFNALGADIRLIEE